MPPRKWPNLKSADELEREILYLEQIARSTTSDDRQTRAYAGLEKRRKQLVLAQAREAEATAAGRRPLERTEDQ